MTHFTRRLRWAAIVCLIAGCGLALGLAIHRRSQPRTEAPTTEQTPPAKVDAPRMPSSPIHLQDIADGTGVTFRHTDGSSGRRYIVEAMSAGIALFDYDADGDVDIYFLNGAPLEGTEVDIPPKNALYRNEGDWEFTDVTDEAGIGDTGFGLGITVGDYDNDGYPDLYVNNYGPNVLYRNRGDGTFADATREADVGNGNKTGAGASFLDIEGDGDLDLYVSSYVQFSYETHVSHTIKGMPAYPGPLDYAPELDVLYRNNGDGTFTDISVESGVAEHAGTGMGMICCDYDNDGDTDIFVANDVMANLLFQNDGAGRFQEVAVLGGTAYEAAGMPQASMGVDSGDYDNDGWPDFYVTSYQSEVATLYRNTANGFFEDVTRLTGAGKGTLSHVTWGDGLVDFDNDGDRDIFIACGHTEDNIELRDDTTSYKARNVLLMNAGDGTFVDVSDQSGDGMRVKQASRGTGFDDLDNDGTVDVVILNSRERPTILRNSTNNSNHWLQIRLCGVKTNRDGVGARVRVVSGDLTQVAEVHSGRGYQSHFGTCLHFGLGKQTSVDCIEIAWIGGGEEVIENVETNQQITIIERDVRRAAD